MLSFKIMALDQTSFLLSGAFLTNNIDANHRSRHSHVTELQFISLPVRYRHRLTSMFSNPGLTGSMRLSDSRV